MHPLAQGPSTATDYSNSLYQLNLISTIVRSIIELLRMCIQNTLYKRKYMSDTILWRYL
jgi:hypothetical protein